MSSRFGHLQAESPHICGRTCMRAWRCELPAGSRKLIAHLTGKRLKPPALAVSRNSKYSNSKRWRNRHYISRGNFRGWCHFRERGVFSGERPWAVVYFGKVPCAGVGKSRQTARLKSCWSRTIIYAGGAGGLLKREHTHWGLDPQDGDTSPFFTICLLLVQHWCPHWCHSNISAFPKIPKIFFSSIEGWWFDETSFCLCSSVTRTVLCAGRCLSFHLCYDLITCSSRPHCQQNPFLLWFQLAVTKDVFYYYKCFWLFGWNVSH